MADEGLHGCKRSGYGCCCNTPSPRSNPHRSAVAEIMGMRFSGFIAWWLWRTIYLMKLPGFERKLRVAIDWTLDLFFPRDIVYLRPLHNAHGPRTGNVGDRTSRNASGESPAKIIRSTATAGTISRTIKLAAARICWSKPWSAITISTATRSKSNAQRDRAT